MELQAPPPTDQVLVLLHTLQVQPLVKQLTDHRIPVRLPTHLHPLVPLLTPMELLITQQPQSEESHLTLQELPLVPLTNLLPLAPPHTLQELLQAPPRTHQVQLQGHLTNQRPPHSGEQLHTLLHPPLEPLTLLHLPQAPLTDLHL